MFARRAMILAALTTLVLRMSVAHAQRIYWTDAGADKIQRANADGSIVQNLVISGLVYPSGIAVDHPADKMYWADRGTGKIQRAKLDGSNVEDLVGGLMAPFGIAIDVSAKIMYWTDAGSDSTNDGKIQRANTDGSNVEELVTQGLGDPYSIALDPIAGKMYWTDPALHRIQRANLNGSSVENIFVGNSLVSPLQVALDLTAGKVYWTMVILDSDGIWRAKLNGSQAEHLPIPSGPFVSGFFGIAVDTQMGNLYWTEVFGPARIRRAGLNGSNATDIITGLQYPHSIAFGVGGPIPTISAWGVAVLTLLMLTAGTVVLRRRAAKLLPTINVLG